MVSFTVLVFVGKLYSIVEAYTKVPERHWGLPVWGNISFPARRLWEVLCEVGKIRLSRNWVETLGCWRWQDYRMFMKESHRQQMEPVSEMGNLDCRWQQWTNWTIKGVRGQNMPRDPDTRQSCRSWYLFHWILFLFWSDLSLLYPSSVLVIVHWKYGTFF